MNNTTKLLGVAAVLVLILAAIIYINQGNLNSTTVNVSEVNEASDLDKVDEDLDKEELDDIDTELEMLEQDYSDL